MLIRYLKIEKSNFFWFCSQGTGRSKIASWLTQENERIGLLASAGCNSHMLYNVAMICFKIIVCPPWSLEDTRHIPICIERRTLRNYSCVVNYNCPLPCITHVSTNIFWDNPNTPVLVSDAVRLLLPLDTGCPLRNQQRATWSTLYLIHTSRGGLDRLSAFEKLGPERFFSAGPLDNNETGIQYAWPAEKLASMHLSILSRNLFRRMQELCLAPLDVIYRNILGIAPAISPSSAANIRGAAEMNFILQ